MIKILKIDAFSNLYGGNIYEDMVTSALNEKFLVERINFYEKKSFYRIIKKSFFYNKIKCDIVVSSFSASFFLYLKSDAKKKIVIIHHLDYKYSPLLSKLYQMLLEKLLFAYKNKIDHIIVVSDYWKNFLLKKGIKKITVIYNGFNIAEYHRSPEEIENFKRKYNLSDKVIIYIGNAQIKKGILDVYDILRDHKGFYLVTSGKPQVNLPILNLDLKREEYITLLHAAKVVVTMSKFKEGWNRVAHESMLCKTPVIGSGTGGMYELLTNGGQLICKDIKELPTLINKAIQEKDKMGLDGFNFAKQFSIENFRDEWVSFIEKCLKDND